MKPKATPALTLTIAKVDTSPVLLSIDSAATTLAMSRAELYRYIRCGALPFFKVGRRVYIETANIPAFVAYLKAQGADAA